MPVKRRKPKAEGAPAYMAQFTALMTILLAFFICLLTVGQDRVSNYKKTGYGYIRNAFGSKGGVGLLPFWRSVMKRYPKVRKKKEEPDAEFLGYMKGAFHADEFDADGISGADMEHRGSSIKIFTNIQFSGDRVALTAEAQVFLDRLAAVFVNLPDYVLTACCYSSTGGDVDKDRMLAAERAILIVRYLKDSGGVPVSRMRSAGYAHDYYLAPLDKGQTKEAVVFLVRKVARKIKA